MSWPVDPLLLGSCMLLHSGSGKTKGETEIATMRAKQIHETLAEESRKCDKE